MAAPSSAAQAVLAKVKDYTSWPKFAENSDPKPSKAHMNTYVVTYYNDDVAAAIKANTLPLPDGALIVKQNKMKADESPHALTIMSKQGGKWFWLEASPDGKVMTMNDMPQEGYDAPMCVKCHSDASKTTSSSRTASRSRSGAPRSTATERRRVDLGLFELISPISKRALPARKGARVASS